VLSKVPIVRLASAASPTTPHELPASPPIRASPYRHKVGSLTDYHPKVAGRDAESSRLNVPPVGHTARINSWGQGRCGWWLPGVGPRCLQAAQSGVGRRRRGGREGILVAQGDTTPGLVSYLRCGCTCTRRPHSQVRPPLGGAEGTVLCTKNSPQGTDAGRGAGAGPCPCWAT